MIGKVVTWWGITIFTTSSKSEIGLYGRTTVHLVEVEAMARACKQASLKANFQSGDMKRI